MSGYVRLHRRLLGHPAFRNDGEAMAFAWMVVKAAWRPTTVRYKGRDYSLERGELSVSVRDFAKAMDRPKGWAERLLSRLSDSGMIVKKSGTQVGTQVGTLGGTVGGTPPQVITICNYDEYQADMKADETPRKTVGATRTGHAQDTEQVREEYKKDKKGRVRASDPDLRKGEGLPEWLDAEAWKAFVAMRRAIPKVSFTPDAAKLVVGKLDKLRGEGYCPTKLLRRAVESSWRTIYPHDDCKADRILNLERGPEYYLRQAEWFADKGMNDDAERCRRKAKELRKAA